ncbi:acyl-CoA thioesterase [Tropicimonas sp. IMCC34043]|uniref:acyl-CoA thioesterase n=1 Tax=Tropicimonas sp. IMCC34043 TaxID=2248760 RepID=UPI000E24704C|nr:acyl-CoA thioesterase [Tropicimonas sp. IMCC34043]
MYPVIRLVAHVARHGRNPLPLDGTHIGHHICWPWDIDPWMELNNGRTLTLYDLGRVAMFHRIGAVAAMRRNGWAPAVAGLSVRFRRRVKVFARFEMRSRIVGWDDRFFYSEQGMVRGGEFSSHALVRLAITDGNGAVPTARVLAELGADPESPPLPEWIAAWIAAEAQRPWPPGL